MRIIASLVILLFLQSFVSSAQEQGDREKIKAEIRKELEEEALKKELRLEVKRELQKEKNRKWSSLSIRCLFGVSALLEKGRYYDGRTVSAGLITDIGAVYHFHKYFGTGFSFTYIYHPASIGNPDVNLTGYNIFSVAPSFQIRIPFKRFYLAPSSFFGGYILQYPKITIKEGSSALNVWYQTGNEPPTGGEYSGLNWQAGADLTGTYILTEHSHIILTVGFVHLEDSRPNSRPKRIFTPRLGYQYQF